MYKVEIYVTLKKDVLDPQGKAISDAAKALNIKNVLDIRQGKYFEVIINNIKKAEDIKEISKKLSNNLLCNAVIEDYRIIKIKKI
jgi:phosphoribosylformylglycinamidine synthase